MIEGGQKSKPQKIPRGFKQNPKNSLDQNLTPKKSYAEFPFHKNLFSELRGQDKWELSGIFRLLWMPEKIPT